MPTPLPITAITVCVGENYPRMFEKSLGRWLAGVERLVIVTDVTIDWGDGTEPQSVHLSYSYGDVTHLYETAPTDQINVFPQYFRRYDGVIDGQIGVVPPTMHLDMPIDDPFWFGA